MQIGDVVSAKDIRALIQEGGGHLHYKAPRGKAFYFLVLGIDNVKHPTINGDAQLRAMGWSFSEDHTPSSPEAA